MAEPSAAETLIGTVKAQAKYSSSVSIGRQAGRNVAGSEDSGPIPPEVGERTSYTVTLVAEAGANDMTNTVVNTSLPLHSNWLEKYTGDGEIIYNSVSKQLEWIVGDISQGRKKEMNFQVDILPSTSQIRTSPTLVNRQTIKANDRFTGELLRSEANAVTTNLSTEMGYPEDNGEVIQ